MQLYRRDIQRIANNSEPPTFINTIAALEDAGRTFHRVSTVFDTFSSTMSDKQLQALETEWSPKLAAIRDEIVQNEALFKRIEKLYNSPEKAKLTTEQQRLLWLTYNEFVRTGAKLSKADKKKLSDIISDMSK